MASGRLQNKDTELSFESDNDGYSEDKGKKLKCYEYNDRLHHHNNKNNQRPTTSH